ncbi:sugar phosphate nucleotidyltransferase [Oscillospiraceae bacterium NTUH-002-81]|nr:sugar phosphate nucleotidyltransferase [Oscillospiraceae bacterium NTUH-002-81]
MKTTLAIMAAGIGSRFGGGIKQLEPVGPNGEIIMDYSIKDALEAGFDRIVFIIRKDLEKDFKEVIGNRIEKIADVAYAYQELDDLPGGFTKPADRTKPWGTGQAILACKDIIHEPFAVINADDYYGKEGFVKLHDYLVSQPEKTADFQFCMVGFILGNTLSDNGAVTRGVCVLDDAGNLVDVNETSNIEKIDGKPGVRGEDGQIRWLDPDSHVSMNMWGLTPDFMEYLEKGFVDFLKNLPEGEIKKEYLLPTIIGDMLQSGEAKVKLLESRDKWFGVTYKEDKADVVKAFKELIAAGVYKEKLFD